MHIIRIVTLEAWSCNVVRVHLSKVLEHMPLDNFLSGFWEHQIPVFDLHGATFTTKMNLTNLFIAAHPVVVHNADHEWRLPYFVVWDVECKRFSKLRIQWFLNDFRFFLLMLSSIKQDPNLDVRICVTIILPRLFEIELALVLVLVFFIMVAAIRAAKWGCC